jgi:D-tyrosyl-tRNA(Tyr) deacylase
LVVSSLLFAFGGCGDSNNWFYLRRIIIVIAMRAVVQRVGSASVTIDESVYSSIKQGLVVLLGVVDSDSDEDLGWLVVKILNMRIFNDEQGVMHLSLLDVSGELLVVSQFTLMARTKKGNRPSYVDAAAPDFAIPMYEKFVSMAQIELQRPVKTGVFGADMKVALVNDGPVTIVMDTKNRA